MKASWITSRQSKSFFLALCDILGSLDGSTNLFIAPLREHPSKEPLSSNSFYRGGVLALCSALAIIDGVVHYHMYSNPKYDPKANAKPATTCSRLADLESQDDQSQLDRSAPSSSKQFMLLSEHSLAFLCAVACSLEVISVPFAALELLKDNEILSEDDSSSVYYTTLGLTLFALVVNVLNASVMYKLSRDNLTSNDQSNSSSVSSSWSQNIAMLQSGSRALFNALGSIIENTNFIIKLCQSIGYLAKDQDFDLPGWAKWLTMSSFIVLASFVAVARYYTYQYYNSDSQQINKPSDHEGGLDDDDHEQCNKSIIDTSKGAHRVGDEKLIPSSNGCSTGCCPGDKKVEPKLSSFDEQAAEQGGQESAAKDTSLFAEPVNTGCRESCCSTASGVRTSFISSKNLLRMGLNPDEENPAFTTRNKSLFCAPSSSAEQLNPKSDALPCSLTDSAESLKEPLLLQGNPPLDQDTQAPSVNNEPSTNKPPLSEETAKIIASLCTASSVVGRMAVPYAFITLFQSSDLFNQNAYWKTVGLGATAIFGAAGLWSSDVVYDFNQYHLTNTKDDEKKSCECC